MKTCLPALCLIVYLLVGCEGSGSSPSARQDTIPPREATDPVPEPPTHADTNRNQSSKLSDNPAGMQKIHYRLAGTEPFWSLTIGQPYSIYRSMEGDSLSFPYQEPRQAAGRPDDWAQVFLLGNQGWAVLRKSRTSCSDGMGDREWTYTATVWLNNQLLDGCGDKE